MSYTPAIRAIRRRGSSLAVAIIVIGSTCAGAQAGDVREGVTAKHGEIVLIRSVPTRTAYRTAPAGMALIIDPSPRNELESALGNTGELTDAEYAAIGSGPVNHIAGSVKAQTGVLATDMQRNDGTRVPVQGANGGVSPMGAVGASTRAAGDQLRSILGAMPIPTNASNGGQ